MRQTRLKIPSADDGAVYHCISRIVDRRFIFGKDEKVMFVQFLREYEQFCGVQVLTHCVMSNHFHILVEVPKRPETMPDGAEVVRRLLGLSGAAITPGTVKQVLAMLEAAGDSAGVAKYLEQFYRRMWDVSEFIKLLKQRFTQWYNRKTGRKGTLWEDRFKSVLVEGEGEPLMAMAAYIDLNPVRAGLVSDPAEYFWCGYGEAMAGRGKAREGLRRLYALSSRDMNVSKKAALEGYRIQVFSRGSAGAEGTDAEGNPLRRGISPKEVVQMIAKKGRVGLTEYLRCRVRYFTDGVAFGSRGFVDGVFGKFRSHFSKSRTTGARRMRGVESELYTARALRVNVIGPGDS